MGLVSVLPDKSHISFCFSAYCPIARHRIIGEWVTSDRKKLEAPRRNTEKQYTCIEKSLYANQICIAVFETLLEEKRITFEEYQAVVRFIK